MNLDLMRKVDYYIGVPLTLVLTVLLKLQGIFLLHKRVAPKKILFIELSEMGSTIIADPAMRKARTELSAELFFVIFAKNKASLDLIGTVPQKNVFTLREDSIVTLIWDTCRFLLWTRRNSIDTVIDLELFSRVSALLTGASGAANRVGYSAFHNEGLYRGHLHTHRVAYNPHMHMAKNFIALVNSLLVREPEVPFSKTLISDDEIRLHQPKLDADMVAAVADKIHALIPDFGDDTHRLILINPNASELLPQRRWPMGNYAQLIKLILDANKNNLVLITGAPAETEEAEGLVDRVGHERCLSFAGALKLLELPGLYSLAEFMVTNDSGPGHFSSVTSMKTFVLFGPETPALYGSLGNSTPIYAGLACSPCVSAANHRKTPCSDNICMQIITPEQVYDEVKSFSTD